jgi:hypothetical protein
MLMVNCQFAFGIAESNRDFTLNGIDKIWSEASICVLSRSTAMAKQNREEVISLDYVASLEDSGRLREKLTAQSLTVQVP